MENSKKLLFFFAEFPIWTVKETQGTVLSIKPVPCHPHTDTHTQSNTPHASFLP